MKKMTYFFINAYKCNTYSSIVLNFKHEKLKTNSITNYTNRIVKYYYNIKYTTNEKKNVYILIIKSILIEFECT